MPQRKYSGRAFGPGVAIRNTDQPDWQRTFVPFVGNWRPRFASRVDTLYKLTVFHHQDAV
jgi:hypothetical protein